MKSLHTLDTVVVCKSKKANGTYPKNYRISRSKMEATLHTIHYKQVIRDAVFRNANDGMYVAYFETASVAPDYRTALTDFEIEGITEINALGMRHLLELPLTAVNGHIINSSTAEQKLHLASL